MSQKIYETTIAGEIVMTNHELDFLYDLTGKTTPSEAAEQFAFACMNHYKEPQEVLRELQIMGSPVFFEGDQEPEQTIHRAQFRLVKTEEIGE